MDILESKFVQVNCHDPLLRDFSCDVNWQIETLGLNLVLQLCTLSS